MNNTAVKRFWVPIGRTKQNLGGNIQQVISKHHVEAIVIFYIMYVWPFVSFWQVRGKTYIWEEN